MSKRKGISPLIATVLVIGFTIVIAAMVITWGTKLFKDTAEETGKLSVFNLLCNSGFNLQYSASLSAPGSFSANDVSFIKPRNPSLPTGSVLKIPKSPSVASVTSSNNIKISAKNLNEKNIAGFFFILKSSNGVTESFTTEQDIEADTFASIFGAASTGEISGYGSKTFLLTPQTTLASGDSWKIADVMPIVLLDTGSLKVCENEVAVQIKA